MDMGNLNKLDPDAAYDDAVQQADLEGWDAGCEGLGPERNPYSGHLAKFWEESRQSALRAGNVKAFRG